MAEPLSVADQALKKLADQLECSICLDSFTDAKLLPCFHTFCKSCLEPMVIQDQHGLSLRCPTCCHSTLLTANGVSGLQPVFHVQHCFEIQDALQKVKQGQTSQCEKCRKREANGFCCNCGKLVCEACVKMHQIWDEYSAHEVISLEQLRSDAVNMVSPTKTTLYCSKHPGNELDLFCETDQELICQHCIVKTHRDHKYDLVSEAFPKHRDAITSHLEPVKQQLNAVNKAIQNLGSTQDQITDQRAVIEAVIQMKIMQFHEAIEARKAELIGQLDRMTQQKLNTLSIKIDELELIRTQLNSCVKFISNSLSTGSEGEILAMEKPVVQQMTEMCTKCDDIKLLPEEQADMALTASSELLPSCRQFGQVYVSQVCPMKCYATGKGLLIATVGEQSTVTVHTIDIEGRKYTKPLPLTSISCELVSCCDDKIERIKCEVKPSDDNEYEINYQPTRRGRHKLYIKVSNQPIRGSPFTVVARGEISRNPIRIITGPKGPFGVAVNELGQVIIAERDSHCISIHSLSGEVKLFGRKGSATGRFNYPRGVAVDNAGNMLVVGWRQPSHSEVHS